MAGLDPPVADMTAFIDDHRDAYGGEPSRGVPPIAPSTCHPMLRHALIPPGDRYGP